MFLAGDYRRNTFVNALDTHGMIADRDRERELAARVGAFDDYEAGQAFRNRGIALTTKDPLLSASMRDRWLVSSVYRPSTFFPDARAYLIIPSQIHRLRARAYEARGDQTGEMRELQIASAYEPANPDCIQKTVRILDARGDTAAADKLYAPIRDRLLKLCSDYPESALAHNQFAWLAGRCRRDLDLALEHAKIACQLDPASAGHVDTLAEVYLARGDKAKALELSAKAVNMAPDVASLKERQKEIGNDQ
jgi:tetratricopeptide (TPR) repeat protein